MHARKGGRRFSPKTKPFRVSPRLSLPHELREKNARKEETFFPESPSHITLGGNNLLPEAQGQHATLKHTTTEAHQSLQTKNNDEPFAKMGGDIFPDASHIPHQIPTICNSKIHGRRFSRTLRKAPRRVHKENRPAGCAQKGTSKDANKKHLEECAQKGTSKDAQ